MTEYFDFSIKLLLVGDTNVGKSSVLLRYHNNQFLNSQCQTIGIDFRSHLINIDQSRIKLQIWDTAGQERFRSITSAYYKGSAGIIIMFDISNRTSFNNVKRWLDEINRNVSENVIKVLVGNKKDLINKRQVSYEEAKYFADFNNILYFEVSAKESNNTNNTNEMFYNISNEIVKRIMGIKIYSELTIKFPENKKKYKFDSVCC